MFGETSIFKAVFEGAVAAEVRVVFGCCCCCCCEVLGLVRRVVVVVTEEGCEGATFGLLSRVAVV